MPNYEAKCAMPPFPGAPKVDQGTMTEGLVVTIENAMKGTGIFTGKKPRKIRSIKIGYVDAIFDTGALYEFDPISGLLKVVASEANEHDAREVMDRSGLCPMEVEFTPTLNETSRFKITGDMIITKGEEEERLPISYSSDKADFEKWFTKVCNLIEDSVIIIPDTNFIRRHYYSRHLKKIIKKSPEIRFLLSRLSIIEVENKYNTNSKKLKGMAKRKQDKKASEPSREDEQAFMAAIERRVAFHTMNEIINMKHDGIDMMPPLSIEDIKAFTDASGADLADPWIRKDLLNLIEGKRKSDKAFLVNIAGAGRSVDTRFVFATADKMNALAAAAENLDTLFFSRTENLKEITLGQPFTKPDIYAFCGLVVSAAIHYGICEFELVLDDGDSLKWTIRGDWSGKSTRDWQNEYVLVEPNEH